MQMTIMQSPARGGRWAFPALIVANLFLALGPWLVRLADVGPVAAGFWRMALAIPLLLLLARRAEHRFHVMPRAMLLTIIVGALFFAADLAAWHAGILRTKLANASLFGNSSSLIFAAYGFVAAGMLPRRIQVFALLLAVLGSALLLGSSYELSSRNFAGDLLTLLAGLFYTFYLIAVDRARRTLAPMPVLALATIAGAPPLLIAAAALGEQVMPVDWTPVILLSLGSQVIGQGLLVYSIGYLTPVVVGLAMLTQPLIGALVGWIVYGEGFGAADALGGLLVCAALVLIRMPERRRS